MAEETTYYCRKCGMKLPLDAAAISKHYEKAHFSDWATQKDLISRMPKAFVSTSKTGPQIPVAEKPKPVALIASDAQAMAQQQANKDNIIQRLNTCRDKVLHKGPDTFVCECCKRTMSSGMRLLCNREHFTLCAECYNVCRIGIPHKTRDMQI